MKTTTVLRLFAFAAAAVAVVSADEVTDWNKILLQALITPLWGFCFGNYRDTGGEVCQ